MSAFFIFVAFLGINRWFLDSVVRTHGEKAELIQRGEAYYRPKNVAKDKDSK